MAAVSCGESGEKNDPDVFKSQSRSCFTVGRRRSSVCVTDLCFPDSLQENKADQSTET